MADILSSFYGLFRGNPSFFVRHEAPFNKDAKKNKLSASWVGFAKYGSKSFPQIPKGFEKDDFVPVTRELYKEHLEGGNGIAVAPITNTPKLNNVCFFAAIDIDAYDVNYTLLVQRLSAAGFKFGSFQSKSGGLHIYFFFEKPEPAKEVIDALGKIVTAYGLDKIYKKGNVGKVEIFPKQATFTPGSTSAANAIFLPYYNSENKGECRNKMLTPDGKLLGLTKAIAAMEASFTTVNTINKILDSLPYNDAPYCIQTILLNGLLSDGDHRSDFLFSSAIYLKKKYKENFLIQLEELNSMLGEPLEQRHVESTYKSVTDPSKNYENYSCKKSPCAEFCDKSECVKREFGKGKKKGNTFTGMDCWGPITKVIDSGGEVQHYLWEVKMEGEEEFKTVRIDDIEDFESQPKIRTACRRDLNWSPAIVKQDAWIDIINFSMQGMKEREIKIGKGSGTSEDSVFRTTVLRFLVSKQVQNSQPFMIKTGRVHKQDGYYYFSTDGVLQYLISERVSTHKMNLYAKLNKFGCEEVELSYKLPNNTKKTVACWRKKEDEEILGMDSYLDDVYVSEINLIEKNFKQKEKKGGHDGDDIKF